MSRNLLLLDSNVDGNAPEDRELTSRLYGGDGRIRIRQELLLGGGGVRALREIGVTPGVYHMNEGHSGFAVLEAIRVRMVDEGISFDQAVPAVAREVVFTTHTPVEAGHDRFSPDLMDYALPRFKAQTGAAFPELMKLGRINPQNLQEPFCMTVLALKTSRAANGVSELHGRVSRHMWHPLFPDKSVDQVPIGHITNGVHLLGWMKGTARRAWRRKLTGRSVHSVDPNLRAGFSDWEKRVEAPEFWKLIAHPDFVSDEELWAFRYKLRRELIEFARRRLLLQGQRLAAGDFIAFDQLLNPDALTIGFARRFATYKRAALLLSVISLIQIIGRGGLQFDSAIEVVSCGLTAAGLYYSFTGDAKGWFNA